MRGEESEEERDKKIRRYDGPLSLFSTSGLPIPQPHVTKYIRGEISVGMDACHHGRALVREVEQGGSREASGERERETGTEGVVFVEPSDCYTDREK